MGIRKTLVLVILVLGLISALPLRAQEKPFTQDQISNMVRDGFGDDSGAKLIEQRGMDFTPGQDFLQKLKAAGASDAFLNAMRASKPPQAASPGKPLNEVQVLALLAGGVPAPRVAMLVTTRGINFDVKDDYVQQVRQAGGDEGIISALKSTKVIKPVNAAVYEGPDAPHTDAQHPDPQQAGTQHPDTQQAGTQQAGTQQTNAVQDAARQEAAKQAEARQADEMQHIARGSELARKADYAQAEQEYRAALQIDPDDAELYVSLAYVMIPQQKWDDTVTAARQAIKLDPDNDMAHNNLGVALGSKGDLDNAITEFRDAVRLNSNYEVAHDNLGVALGIKGDVDGAIAEYREAIRLNPKYEVAHYNLGIALEQKGDKAGALEEYHTASVLKPNDVGYLQNYQRLLKQAKK